ncbi:COMPASS complex protein [Tricholoma matsutake]|nr:COMPASS complex protein [Tricholoma matsutake 945]
MLAEGSSPPPDTEDLSLPLNVPNSSVCHPTVNGLPSHPRKRKRAPVTASSPAPSDLGSASGNPPELISSRADLSTRPQLSISRGPLFVPVAEGSEYCKTEMCGVNRVGFRYVPAGINPMGYTQPCRTIESNPTAFRVSWEDRSPFVKVTQDGLGLCGGTGFRSARCNAPMTEGRWYMEVKILRGGGEHASEDAKREGSHVRLGWGRREAPLNGPVGLDGYSYGYRDKTGEKVTLSRPRPFGRSYGTGDVVGMYISLPLCRQANKNDPHDPAHIKRERIPIDLKGQEVFEMLEYPQSKEMTSLMDYSGKSTNSASVPSTAKKTVSGKIPDRGGPPNATKVNSTPLRPLPTLPGSRIAFFVNGQCQGIAFQDIYDYLQLRQTETSRKAKEKKRTREGVKEHRENPFNDGSLGYYPFISLFNDACVRLNPGPDFAFPPPADIDALLDNTESKGQTWRPACERYAEFMAEQWALDAQEEEEARVEAFKAATAAKVDAEKKAARLKKRQETAARKRAKVNPLLEQGAPGVDDDRFGPGSSTPGLGQPSPLRHGTTYDAAEGSVDHSYSPAPTFVSNGEFQGGQSGYNSEVEQGNGEEHPYGVVHTEASSPTHVPQSPQGEFNWDPSRLTGPGFHVE